MSVAIVLRPLTPAQAREVVCWRYDPPYDIYNIAPNVQDEAAIAREVAVLLDPATHAHALLDPAGNLLGLATFGSDGQVPGGDYPAGALDMGISLRPDLTGRQLGRHFLQAMIDFAGAHFPAPALRVTVAEFNRRAQRLVYSAGFQPVATFTGSQPPHRRYVILLRPDPTQQPESLPKGVPHGN